MYRNPFSQVPALVVAVLLATIVFFAAPVPEAGWAQTPSDAPQDSERLTPEIIQKDIDRIERSTEIDDKAKASILALYQEAIQDVVRATTWLKKAEAYRQDNQAAAKDLERAKAALADNRRQSRIEIPIDASVRQLERALAEAEANYDAAEKKWKAAKSEPGRRASRQLELKMLLKQSRERVATLKRQWEETPSTKNEHLSPNDVARHIRLRAALELAQAETEAYANEVAKYRATADLLPINIDLGAREVARARDEIETLKRHVSEVRGNEVQTQITQAKQKLAKTDPLLLDIARRNEGLAEERMQLIEKTRNAEETLKKRNKRLSEIKSDYLKVQEQLKRAGRTKTIASYLKTQRVALRDEEDYSQSMEARLTETLETEAQIILLADLRAQLASRAELLVMAQESEQGEEQESYPGEAAERRKEELDLVRTQKEYVDQLARERQRYFNVLMELDTTEQGLNDEIESFLDYIDEQVLWIRSMPPIWDMTTWKECRHCLNVIHDDSWHETISTIVQEVRERLLLWVGMLLVLTLLVVSRQRGRSILRHLGQQAEASGMQCFLPTAQAALLTALFTLPAFGALAFVSWRLASHPGPVSSLGVGLWTTTLVSLPLDFVRRVCRPRGLAESHFGWPSSAVARIRGTLLKLMFFAFPLVMITASCNVIKRPEWLDTFGRFSFIAILCITSGFMHNLFRKQGSVFRAFFAEHPDKWISRVFLLGYVLTVAVPWLLIVVALLGYYFTACHLATRWYVTVVFASGLLLLGAFLLRWILVVRRRLAIENAMRQRELIQAAHAQQTEGNETANANIAPAADIGPDLATINLQTRQLLFVILGVVACLGLWFIWDDVFPAFGVLKEIRLWDVTGNSVLAISRTITLADLAWALLITGLTLIAARNIPGLLEMSLLHRLPIDKGLRFAITTVSRYTLVAVGILWACNHLGLSWSKVQWILAAMSVGLGFGLQEIFANFVSGMVILFERPIRIGDIITIGDATGRVSKIRMRATTIIDWDKKELVVPNKEFATGRLLNWTLTDTVNRLVIDVGVSYKSDPDRVREILLQCAADHPKVVDSPKPICIFREFGASSLMFSLRIYLASMKGRLDVIHEMHTAVHKALREAGIEIAYPQLDLHVRSGYKDDQSEIVQP